MTHSSDDDHRKTSPTRPPLTSTERGFWRDVAEAVNPGWQIGIGDSDTHAASPHLDLFVYAFDTSNLWLGAGALEGPQAKVVVTEALTKPVSRDEVMNAAATAIIEAADANATATDRITHIAVKLTWHALSRTRTYSQVEAQNPTLRGHWIYALYRLKGGAYIARPFFTQQSAPGLMDTTKLIGLVRQVVALDLANPNSTVGSELAEGGGPILAAQMRA